AVLGLLWFLPPVRRALIHRKEPWSCARWAVATVLAIVVGAALHAVVPPYQPADPIYQAGTTTAPPEVTPVTPPATEGDWLSWGHDPNGSRFSTLSQITPDNVGKLEKLWDVRLNDTPGAFALEATPIKVGNSLYFCTSANDLVALDSVTGKQLWRFEAHVNAQ